MKTDMMLHNHLRADAQKGKEQVKIKGHPSVKDRRETECTERKVTRKHDDLQEIAYETFGPVSPR